MKGKLLLSGFFVLSLGLFSTGLFGSSSASAVSVYDDMVVPAPSLVLTNKQPTQGGQSGIFCDALSKVNFDTDYLSYMLFREPKPNDPNIIAARNAWDNRSDNAQWAVFLTKNQNNHTTIRSDTITFQLFPQGGAAYSFVTNSSSNGTSYSIAQLNPVNAFTITLYGMNQLDCSDRENYKDYLFSHTSRINTVDRYHFNTYSASTTPADYSGNSFYYSFILSSTRSSQSNQTVQPYVMNVPIHYPQDYEGPIIPDSKIPTKSSDWAPAWVTTKYEDFRVDFADDNFFSTNMKYPFLCGEDGFAPIIEYQVINMDTQELIEEGQFSASSALSFQFEKVPERRDYMITGNYADCEGYTFSKSSSKVFMFNAAGGQHIESFFEMCFKEDFPFVDMDGCIGAIEDIINTLSFGSVKFGNDWTHSPTCYQSQKLHTWINLPSQNLCPQFSADVRNTVTPFVTFALGLTTLLFITNRRDT